MQRRLATKEDGQGDGRVVMSTGDWPTSVDGRHQRQPNGNGRHLPGGWHGQLDGEEEDESSYQFHRRLPEFASKVLHFYLWVWQCATEEIRVMSASRFGCQDMLDAWPTY